MKYKTSVLNLSNEAYQIIKDAASLSKSSIESYVLCIVLKQAKHDIAQEELITVNNIERDSLMCALCNTPKPNQELIDLLK